MKRLSNIELLRGILMLMIVMVHLIGNGVLKAEEPIPYTHSNWLIANTIDAICYPAVNCFILISGYFGINLTLKRFLKLEVPILLYGIIAWLLLDRHMGGAITALFPFLNKSYWFVTSYMLLMIFSPIINNYVKQLDEKTFRITLLIGIGLIVIVPSVTPFCLSDPRGMDVINFSLLYMLGRYLGMFKKNISFSNAFAFYCVASCICLALTVILAYTFGINKGWKSPFYSYNHILVYIQSIGLFYMFRNISIPEKSGMLINKLAPSFFYVYIIHESPFIHRNLYDWIDSAHFYYSPSFLLHTTICAVVLFVLCVTIDIIIRRILFQKVLDYIIDRILVAPTFLSQHMFRQIS